MYINTFSASVKFGSDIISPIRFKSIIYLPISKKSTSGAVGPLLPSTPSIGRKSLMIITAEVEDAVVSFIIYNFSDVVLNKYHLRFKTTKLFFLFVVCSF